MLVWFKFLLGGGREGKHAAEHAAAADNFGKSWGVWCWFKFVPSPPFGYLMSGFLSSFNSLRQSGLFP
jgi:hypothetical protein